MIERRDKVMQLIGALKRELVHAKPALDRARAAPAYADSPPPAALASTKGENAIGRSAQAHHSD
jgi:hypothetical protein